MPRVRLSDEQVADIRATAAEGGQTLQEIAERFGTSKQHVHRLVRGEQRQDFPQVDLSSGASVTAAVEQMLEALCLSGEDDVVAATALALAEKLDSVRMSPTAQAAMAAPGLARQLSEQLAALRQSVGLAEPRIGGLRGEEAVLVARELGFANPEEVDIEVFDQLTVLQLRRERRLSTAARFEREGFGDWLVSLSDSVLVDAVARAQAEHARRSNGRPL
jgi:transcriptional regulator with XRE-family HTH domain